MAPEATRPSWRIAGRITISLALVVLIFGGLLPQLADLGGVWAEVRAMRLREVGVLVLAALVPLVSMWVAVQAVFADLGLRRAGQIHLAGTAVANTVPAGGAVALGMQYAMLGSCGQGPSRAASGMLLAAVGDQMMKVGVAAAAAAVVMLSGELPPRYLGLVGAGVVVFGGGVALFAVVLSSDRYAALAGRVTDRIADPVVRRMQREPLAMESRLVSFRRETAEVLAGGWPRWIGGLVVAHASLFVLLLLSLRAVGVQSSDVGTVRVLLAFAVTRLLTAIPVTPGGLGIAEASYAAILSIGLEQPLVNRVVAGVLVFRALTYLLPIPLGGIAWMQWSLSRARRAAPNS